MHYAAILNDREVEVEITELEPGSYRIAFDDKIMEVDAQAISESTLSVLHDDAAYNIELERRPSGGGNVLVRGNVVQVEVIDLRRMRLRKVQEAHVGPEGPATITSPMPGKIVAILVQEGQEVAEGDGLLVVEAMKMENELRAPKAGTIRSLTAQEGEAVDGGVALCVVA